MEFIHLSHCVDSCNYHIVLVTKYRKEVFNEGIFEYCKKKLAEIVDHYPLIRIETMNHDKDHIHLLVSIPPTMSIYGFISHIKLLSFYKVTTPRIKEMS